MTEKETMKLIIRHEYEKKELGEYKPRKFADYLLDELSELRTNKQKSLPIDSVVCF